MAATSTAQVWDAHDRLLVRRVALKLLRPELADAEEARRRFCADARSAARLAHPAVARVFDYGAHGSTLYVVTELVEGEDLSSLLARRGPLDAAQSMRVVAQVASLLAAARACGVPHRRIETADLVVETEGRVKVVDLSPSGPPGTPTGKVEDEADDVHALGVIAQRCLTGTPACGDVNPAVATRLGCRHDGARVATMPADVRRLVTRMLEPDHFRSVATVAEVASLAEGLAEAHAAEPHEPRHPGRGTAHLRWSPSRSLRRPWRQPAALLRAQFGHVGAQPDASLLGIPDRTAGASAGAR